MKNSLIFALFVIAVIAILFLLPRKEVPLLPSDTAHLQTTVEKDCLICHGKDAPNPLSRKHPPKFACFKCHKGKK